MCVCVCVCVCKLDFNKNISSETFSFAINKTTELKLLRT